MMDWLRSWLGIGSSSPPHPDEEDHFYGLEQAVQEALLHADAEVAKYPDNHHLKVVRNHLADAYICLWRASQRWEKYHREAG